MEDRKTLLSVKDLQVQFHVRGRLLTAIRGVSLDIYENECIAIVGESGSGKSVFTKTFAGMLDSNGFVSRGSIDFADDELTEFRTPKTDRADSAVKALQAKLNEYAKLENGKDTWQQLQKLERDEKARGEIAPEKAAEYEKRIAELKHRQVQMKNLQLTLDPKTEKEQLNDAKQKEAAAAAELKQLQAERASATKAAAEAGKADTAAHQEFLTKQKELQERYASETAKGISKETEERNLVLAREVYMTAARCELKYRRRVTAKLQKALREAMKIGVDLNDPAQKRGVFENITFPVFYEGETNEELQGHVYLNLAKVAFPEDWCQIRGSKIATVFQDPMTSLNPIITIGKQISAVIMKHQKCSESEARARALTIMAKVGIPNPAARYDDYPFQYSGGMRQRIVIAIALSCRPKILICDEPTTALDVTIQAQILRLIKDLQKEFGFTTVFITHDLGVVANVADRVAVLYAGQIVEVGTVEEIFYDPRHPYTWALLSSLPQLAERNTTLFSITGTPPSLYNEITGDAFAPRNPYCLKIDTLAEPPMMQVSDTHYAKTWLLHPDAPKMEKPEIIRDIHGRLMKTFNI